MSTVPISIHAAPAPPPTEAESAVDDAHSTGHIESSKQASPAFLHSPPDSNNAHKSDATDSELSDLDEEPVLPDADQPQLPTRGSEKHSTPPETKCETDTQDDDIGDVLPDHWSGAVAVFKPTMHQFKDFNRFVRFEIRFPASPQLMQR